MALRVGLIPQKCNVRNHGIAHNYSLAIFWGSYQLFNLVYIYIFFPNRWTT